MAHIGKREDMPNVYPLTEAMARCGSGKPVSDVAQAALDLALGLWAISGEVTRDMAVEVVTSQIDALFKNRSN